MEMRLVAARSHGSWVMGGRTRLWKVSTGTPGGDGAISRLHHWASWLCCSSARCYHWGKWSKGYKGTQSYSLHMHAAAAKSLQSCPTLCDPIDGSPPGSPVPGILQARTLEWVTISVSNAWKWKVKVKSLSRVRPSVTPWTAAFQAPPSMGFSRQEYWSGVPLTPQLHAWICSCD